VNAADGMAGVASTVQRLAVLLGAGVTPVAAWGYLERSGVVASVVAATETGNPIPAAIASAAGQRAGPETLAWRGLATAWAVATEAGAPLAPTLREFAASLRDLAQSHREIAVALSAPVATARLVMALPAIGIVFGMVLGFNTIATLATTPVGWVCLGFGGALMFGAARWNRRLVRRAQPTDVTPGLEFDLVAIAVSGGGALDRATALVAESVQSYLGTDRGRDSGIDAVLDLSRRAGVPAAELLRSEASELRRRARTDAQERAQALSVRLMIPLGVCVLPAFMIVGVVPLLVSVIQSTAISL
jgi:tight adherence protein B